MTRARNTADTQTASGGPVPPGIAGKNGIINGAMDIWQRGTSIAINSSWAYTTDRWTLPVNVNQTATVSRQLTSDTTNLPNIQYCARVQRNSGSTGTGGMGFTQCFESVNSRPYIGQTVTLSFYARKGANYSPTGNALTIYGISGTGTDETRANQVFTGEAYWINNQSATLTSTWQRFTFTGTVSSAANQIAVFIGMGPTGTAGAADYFEVTGVQLELGSTATPFSRAGGTIQGELAACQRYYFLKASGSGQSFGMAAYNSASDIRGSFGFPVEMRIVPTLVSTSGTNYYVVGGTVDYFNSLTLWQSSTKETAWYNVSQASGTTGLGGVVWTDNASASIALSAEL